MQMHAFPFEMDKNADFHSKLISAIGNWKLLRNAHQMCAFHAFQADRKTLNTDSNSLVLSLEHSIPTDVIEIKCTRWQWSTRISVDPNMREEVIIWDLFTFYLNPMHQKRQQHTIHFCQFQELALQYIYSNYSEYSFCCSSFLCQTLYYEHCYVCNWSWASSQEYYNKL